MTNGGSRVRATVRDYNRAILDYTEAIKFDQKYVDAYNNRGLAHKALGRKAEAIADFRKALSIDPTDKKAQNELKSLGG